jgi:hypothetical protein
MITKFKKFFEKNSDKLKELEEKTKRSIRQAQLNNSPTYYDYVSKSIETTPSISSRKQSLSYLRKEGN